MYIKDIINELSEIKEYLDENKINTNNLECTMFEQSWDNISGGFEEMGGSIITKQNTYVMYNNRIAHVFFGNKFAYTATMNRILRQDIENKDIAGFKSRNKRYIIYIVK